MALPYTLISPLLIFGAEQDDWAPPIVCEGRKVFTSGEEIEVVVYPNTYHGFDLPVPIHQYAGYTIGGNNKATVDSRKKMVDFFKTHMK